MHRSYTAWLVTVALALIGFGLDVKSAIAQQLYTFNATYDVFSTSKPITPVMGDNGCWVLRAIFSIKALSTQE